jgi:hypothetical protein
MSSSKASARREAPTVAQEPVSGRRPGAVLAAWLVPGAGHVMLGELRKGAVFCVALTIMFACGVAFGGRLFSLQFADPLVLLAAIAQWGVGVPRALGTVVGFGEGDVVAATYEYGNTFLITAGLLNALVVLDAYDLATGRKAR